MYVAIPEVMAKETIQRDTVKKKNPKQQINQNELLRKSQQSKREHERKKGGKQRI
jgi:hypothetical protein